MSRVELADGVAVITGAARGLGAGLARAAASKGMKLALADIDGEAVHRLAQDFRSQGVEAIALPTDVGDPKTLEKLAHDVADQLGPVRLLANNAGIEMIGECWTLSASDWESIVRINLLGPILNTRAFVEPMIAAGKPAVILNVASLAALGMMPLQTPYIVTKHALLAFSEGLYLELAHRAPMIQVAVALPGPIATDIFNPSALRAGDAVADRMHKAMQTMLSAGMSPEEAGALIVDRASAGEFWIATHPDMLEEAAMGRVSYLSSTRRPTLHPKMDQMLRDAAS